MMIPAILSALVVAAPADIVCPIMGSKVPATAKSFDDYAGVRYTYCCGGCSEDFKKNPTEAIAKVIDTKQVSGKALFDPISRQRIEEKNAKASSDYKGVRYFFTTTAEKAKFDKKPADYATIPAKESMTCPVSHEVIGGYANAIAYRNIDGVRYYICCAGCVPEFDKDPKRYTAKIQDTVKAPGFANPVAHDH